MAVKDGAGAVDRSRGLPPAEQRAAAVQRMFGSIAARYDLLNHLLSANMDRRWRRQAVDRLLDGRTGGGLYLDACAGTLDLAVELARRDTATARRVVASDFALPMLLQGRSKVARLAVDIACADALSLPFANDTFDGASVGFGVRNLADLGTGLRELARVIRPGGRLMILEFMTPRWQPFRALYLFYFRRVLPLVGRWISRHGSAYSYLPESVLAFPEPAALASRMQQAGFTSVRWDALTGGIVAVHTGERARELGPSAAAGGGA